MATTWKTTAVRVERPPGVSPAEFVAIIETWLSHQCILLAGGKAKTNTFHAVFDNPRDARLFKRRFAVRPISRIPLRDVSHPPGKATSAPVAVPPGVGGLVPVGDTA